MQAQTTSLLTIGLLLLAAAAALAMLEAQGRLKAARQPKALIRAHRLCAYAFALLFVLLWGAMTARSLGIRAEFSPRIALHVALAAAVACLLAIKILIARRYRRHFAYLPAVGGLLLIATAVLVTLTAGYHFLQQAQRAPVEAAAVDAPAPPRENRPQAGMASAGTLVEQKCARCHPLERVYREKRTLAQWGEVVDRMAENAEEIGEVGLWTLEERDIIVRHLAQR